MLKAVGNIVGFIGVSIMIYGVFELNKFIGAGLVLLILAQASIRYAEKAE